MYRALMLWVLCIGSCWADEWSTADTWREVTYQALWAVDWMQTRNISRSSANCRVGKNNEVPDCHYITELNHYLGSSPTNGAVNRYFLVGSVLHYGVSKFLQEEYRMPFQYVTIGIEVGYVSHNFSIGVSAKF